MNLLSGLSKWTKISLITSILIVLIFIGTQIYLANCHDIETVWYAKRIQFTILSIFVITFSHIAYSYVKRNRRSKILADYARDLNKILIEQMNNPLFYSSDIKRGAEILTKQVSEAIGADRCSIWLYTEDRNAIVCDKLYVATEGRWYEDTVLNREHFEDYFKHLEIDPVIVAHDAHEHPATSCFSELYLKPLGINSMLDVPIMFKDEMIGVICIERFQKKKWILSEVNFARLLSSLYTFAYTIRLNEETEKELHNFEKFVDESVLISRADCKGRITYVNKKFEEVSGWKSHEVIGQDHRFVNSGYHHKRFWSEMYRTTVKDRKIWNKTVVNKTKKGKLYWVDSFIVATFDPITDKHTGYISIRQDVTGVYESLQEIENKNTYLEHAAKILRHDMHSGINTYIPRGISSLERRLKPEIIKDLKLEAPLKMLKEGLKHTQKVYRGVYEFTNLVKKDVILEKTRCDLKTILTSYLESTSYSGQVIIEDLPELEVNESLFCTAVDNLIRNGLKYNDSSTKFVKIYMENDKTIVIKDNGRGLTQKEFDHLSKPYTRKEGQKEPGSGLGLNICTAILKEHGFSISCEKAEDIGTKMKIHIKKSPNVL
jgi:PAS domain S-box-containing protein